jgi:hypothetical protein
LATEKPCPLNPGNSSLAAATRLISPRPSLVANQSIWDSGRHFWSRTRRTFWPSKGYWRTLCCLLQLEARTFPDVAERPIAAVQRSPCNLPFDGARDAKPKCVLSGACAAPAIERVLCIRQRGHSKPLCRQWAEWDGARHSLLILHVGKPRRLPTVVVGHLNP